MNRRRFFSMANRGWNERRRSGCMASALAGARVCIAVCGHGGGSGAIGLVVSGSRSGTGRAARAAHGMRFLWHCDQPRARRGARAALGLFRAAAHRSGRGGGHPRRAVRNCADFRPDRQYGAAGRFGRVLSAPARTVYPDPCARSRVLGTRQCALAGRATDLPGRAVLDRLSGADHRRGAPGAVARPAAFCVRAARVHRGHPGKQRCKREHQQRQSPCDGNLGAHPLLAFMFSVSIGSSRKLGGFSAASRRFASRCRTSCRASTAVPTPARRRPPRLRAPRHKPRGARCR